MLAIAATNAPPTTVQNLHLKTEAPRDPAIKREMRRRSAVEPVIGHLKDEHRMAATISLTEMATLTNAILAAAGYKLPPPHQVAQDFVFASS